MGFGYLLLGYLCTFLLTMTANQLGIGSLTLLLGEVLMLLGVNSLEKYEKRFFFAKPLLVALLVGGVYQAAREVLAICKIDVPFFSSAFAGTLYNWYLFLFIMLLQVVLLLAIAALSKTVGLVHLRSKAYRNLIFLGLYGLLYLIRYLPFAGLAAARPYLTIPMSLCLLLAIVLNLFLFLSCMKNIAPAGEEDLPPKRYRWEFLNKVGDAFDRNRREAAESGRAYAEEKLRKRKEAREQKRITHNKKK